MQTTARASVRVVMVSEKVERNCKARRCVARAVRGKEMSVSEALLIWQGDKDGVHHYSFAVDYASGLSAVSRLLDVKRKDRERTSHPRGTKAPLTRVSGSLVHSRITLEHILSHRIPKADAPDKKGDHAAFRVQLGAARRLAAYNIEAGIGMNPTFGRQKRVSTTRAHTSISTSLLPTRPGWPVLRCSAPHTRHLVPPFSWTGRSKKR